MKKNIKSAIPMLNQSLNFNKTQAWVRFFSRQFDIVIFSSIFFLFFSICFPTTVHESDLKLIMLSMFLWVFVEAILLSTVGTTPGKWILNVKLKSNEGKKIKFFDALIRSLHVWSKGLGIGLPFISAITNIASYLQLKKYGITPWDREGKYTISYGEIGIIRFIVLIFVISLIVFDLYFKYSK